MRLDINRVATAAIEAALEDGRPRRRRLSPMRAVATGAALAVAARVAAKRAPLHRLGAVPDRLRDELYERGWLQDDAEDEDFEDEEEFEEDQEFEDDDDEPDDRGPEDDEPDPYDDAPEDSAEPDDAEEPDEEPEEPADEPRDREEEPEEPEEPDEEPEEPADEPRDQEEEPDEEPKEPPEEPEDEPPDDEDEADEGGRATPALELADGDGDRRDVLELLSTRRPQPKLMSRARARAGSRVDPATRPPEPPEPEAGDEGSNTKRKAG